MRTLFLLSVLATTFCAGAQTVFDVAQARTMPAGAPKASDVIMRSLRLHPRNAQDPRDTLQALRDFHVTRLEWAYIDSPEFIAKVKAEGRLFGGAASAPSYLHDSSDPGWFEKVVIVNLDGDPIIAPWKRNWNRTLWGCINNPELERGYLAYLKRYIDAGAQVMQRDEPRANLLATRWGGCFCDHCMAGFRNWLRKRCNRDKLKELGIQDINTFDYRDHLRQANAPVGDAFKKWEGGELKEKFVQFQEEASIAFHRRMRAAIDTYAGRPVPMSANNGARLWDATQMAFDWAFGELNYGHTTAVQLHGKFKDAAGHDRIQVVTMPKASDWEQRDDLDQRTRQAIAMTYACGGHCMVPWDTYMPGDSPRYFGTPDQYADLFGFIRACAPYLDGYEEAAVVGKSIGEDRYGDALPVTIAVSETCYAVVRALPGKANAPAVVHLVDWAASSAPLDAQLHADQFYPGKELDVTLLTPTPYNKEQHDTAEKTGDFTGLARRVPVQVDDAGRFRVPALGPWGILVVRPR
ncbi:MAG: hypothetical protein GY851_18435 [bacterium]|nr:hypothetical protein [bacterium]